MVLRIPFDSPETCSLNQPIFKTIYLAAVKADYEMAEARGMSETYEGSPAPQGQLQCDPWILCPLSCGTGALREKVVFFRSTRRLEVSANSTGQCCG